MGRLTAAAAAAALALGLGACSHGPQGLGRHACPYLRPRLVRVDTDRADLSDPARRADLAAVAQDIAIYVTQLPAGGKAAADRPLVAFSAALTRFVRDGDTAALERAEAPVRRECRVPGY